MPAATAPTITTDDADASIRGQFWFAATRGSVAACAYHVVFGVVFLALGLTWLAGLEVLSVATYVAVLVCAHRGRFGVTLPLTAVELFGHATVTSWALGWGTGFHLYALLLVPVCLQAADSVRFRLLVAGAASLAYGAMDVWLEGAPARVHLASGALLAVRVANLALFFGLFVMLCFVYGQAIRAAQDGLRRSAERDPLTGLFNRRTALARATARATGVPGAGTWLVFVDIDHFKAVNDTFGHATGDAAIQFVAARVTECVRAHDTVARWGGEEFLVVLADVDRATALRIAERIRESVTCPRPDDPAPLPAITVTAGVSEHHAGEELERAICRADEALYLGKSRGRNRVEVAGASGAG